MDKGFKAFFVSFFTFCFVAIFMISLIKDVSTIYGKYEEKDLLDKKLISLKHKESQLKVDVEKLQDPDYIARYAREKYFYSKDGEFIIRIPEDE